MEFSPTKQPGWPQLPPGLAFRMVSNIAEDSAGRLYFVHRGAPPLVRFDPAGAYLGSIGDSALHPSVNYDLSRTPPAPISREYWLHGLHVDPWDNVWVTDLGRHLVLKFDPQGRLALTLGTDGVPGEDATHFCQPTAVAVGRSGAVYVADGYGNARIAKFSATGQLLASWGRRGTAPGEFNTPHGLALDADENVYVAERMNDRVQVFDSAGRLRAVWPGLRRADAVLVTRAGEVLVGTGHLSNTIHRFDREGRLRGVLGRGAEAFGYPHGVHVDAAGHLHVADPVAEQAAARPARYLRLSPAP
ncbi:MAG: hypothetical protein JNG83_00275 [Opitutaceae bacterium]|nr:hypothetical protein [Opitutaceae bacterium]